MYAQLSGYLMKTTRIYIRLSDYEKQQLEKAAIKREMNQSDLVRSMIARLPGL
jgi:hypothetical protein